MNKERRKALKEIIETLESIKDIDLSTLLAEEEEYRDNIPENLQCSEKYDASTNSRDSLDQAIGSIEDAICFIQEAIE